MRLDRWFKRRLPALSLSHLNKIVRKGEVRVDGKRCTTATRLTADASVRVPPLDLKAEPAAPGARPVARAGARGRSDAQALKDMTLYEDAHVLVLNKPFGLAVQGGSGMKQHIDGMLAALERPDGTRPHLVHRLDRDTSGVLLVAKTRKVAADLGEAFRGHLARKIYWAIVAGVPRPAQGRISLFLAKGEGMGDVRAARKAGPREAPRAGLEKMRVAQHGEADAQHSVTYYALVEKAAPQLAWLSMKPITGRTHQLRAHAEAMGHPILGDPKYGGPYDAHHPDPMAALPATIERKLHLLARRLILPHPRGGMIDVSAPLPPHMQKTFDLFGFDTGQRDPIFDAPE
ncbi:MAG: RluA family pseudouridine synthase [Hyphomicrobiales bacterium]|nr:RluA family pseudouridine synthase [Hyphomicrobiales bacterium]